MGKIRLFVCAALFGTALFGATFAVFSQETVHTLRAGETLYSLARQYGVTVRAIQDLNGIADPARVQAGQRIRIPAQAGTAPAEAVTARTVEYQAQRGDTLYSLARRYGTTPAAILEASGFGADHVLKAGDRLRIPRSGAEAAPARESPATETPATETPAAPATVTPATETPAGNRGAGTENPARATTPARINPAVRWPIQAREVAYVSGNLGVVLLGERSEPVLSLTRGEVISAGPYRGFGKVAVIQVAGGYYYVYGGCESLAVKEGDQVSPGTELGKLGMDGVTSQPRLFFRVYRGATPVDPAAAPRS